MLSLPPGVLFDRRRIDDEQISSGTEAPELWWEHRGCGKSDKPTDFVAKTKFSKWSGSADQVIVAAARERPGDCVMPADVQNHLIDLTDNSC